MATPWTGWGYHPDMRKEECLMALPCVFFFSHRLEIQLQKGNQNTTNIGEPTQPDWKSRNNTHLWPNFPHDNYVTLGRNKAFDPPSRITSVKNILVSHVRGLLQMLKSMFPFNHTIVLRPYRVSHFGVHGFNWDSIINLRWLKDFCTQCGRICTCMEVPFAYCIVGLYH